MEEIWKNIEGFKCRKVSKYPGVFFKNTESRKKRWGAAICLNSKQKKHIGYFKTEEEAYNAYRKALIENSIDNKYAIFH